MAQTSREPRLSLLRPNALRKKQAVTTVGEAKLDLKMPYTPNLDSPSLHSEQHLKPGEPRAVTLLQDCMGGHQVPL